MDFNTYATEVGTRIFKALVLAFLIGIAFGIGGTLLYQSVKIEVTWFE